MNARAALDRRAFLNRPGQGGLAAIRILIMDRDCEVTISDCHRTVTLDFPIYERGERANALPKVKLLIQMLSEFQVALAERIEECKEEERTREARRRPGRRLL